MPIQLNGDDNNLPHYHFHVQSIRSATFFLAFIDVYEVG